jgi:hypothetical protein
MIHVKEIYHNVDISCETFSTNGPRRGQVRAAAERDFLPASAEFSALAAAGPQGD